MYYTIYYFTPIIILYQKYAFVHMISDLTKGVTSLSERKQNIVFCKGLFYAGT